MSSALQYNETVEILIAGEPVKLTACPAYKRGAYYVGRVDVAGRPFKVKAICVQSTAGGRAWLAWDERLEKKLELHSLGDSNRRSTEINIGPTKGEYIVVIHPLSENEDE